MKVRSGWFDCEVSFWRKTVTQDATYGTDVVAWVPLVAQAGSPSIPVRWPAEVQDALPSRDEALQQGVVIGRQRSRLRMRYRNDIDGGMRVTVHRDSDVDYMLISEPAQIMGRKSAIEMAIERYSG